MLPAGLRFVARDRYGLGAALGLTLGGVPGVLIAAYLVRSLPIVWLRWLVVVGGLAFALLLCGVGAVDEGVVVGFGGGRLPVGGVEAGDAVIGNAAEFAFGAEMQGGVG